MTSVP
ncbi:hypothetical protein E2C01_092265 [Portunus trituberculatus]